MDSSHADAKPPEPEGLQESLGYRFHDISLLAHALTHPSSTSEKLADNERLEFFGDSILDFIVCEHLFYTYPHRPEGELTEVKSALVRRRSLAFVARELNIRPYLGLGRGIALRKTLPDSVYANVFEAIVAAIYQDGGMEPAREFVLRVLRKELDRVHDLPVALNYKSVLQQELQRERGVTPRYTVIRTSGPDHNKVFVMAALCGDEEVGRGEGGSKKMAEQNAAKAALESLVQAQTVEGELVSTDDVPADERAPSEDRGCDTET